MINYPFTIYQTIKTTLQMIEKFMQQIKKLPAIDGQLGWFESVSFARPMPVQQAEKDEHFDVIIIGAGFSGLATAGRLAELRPEARIALIDAMEVGQGSSGRNAGFIIDLPHNLDPTEPDVAVNNKVRDLNNFAIQRLKRIQEQQGFDVSWHEAGKYLAAHEEKHLSSLSDFVNTLEAIGESYEVLDDDALAKRLGTHYYKRAVYTSGNILVNPAALAISVASALPSNVTLLENTPIHEIDLANKVIQTPKARLSADIIVLATNAFTEKFGVSSNRITPIFTYASLTRPLTELEMSELKAFSGKEKIAPWGLTSAHPAGTTVRLTSDKRIFIRNTLNYQPNLSSSKAVLDKAKAKHRKSYLARFPQLPNVPFEYTWGGMICVTMNHEPVFKEHAAGVYVVAAMNGVGVAKGTYLGNYMAEFICGKESSELAFILKHAAPSRIPPDPLRSVGAHIRLSFEEYMAKGEV